MRGWKKHTERGWREEREGGKVIHFCFNLKGLFKRKYRKNLGDTVVHGAAHQSRYLKSEKEPEKQVCCGMPVDTWEQTTGG